MQLARLAEDYDKIKQAGAELIAISSDNQTYSWSTAQTTGAKYQILSDSDRAVIKAYGVLNAKEHGGVAHPAVFIVGKGGQIRFIYVGKDPGDRPEDSLLIEEIKKIAAAG